MVNKYERPLHFLIKPYSSVIGVIAGHHNLLQNNKACIKQTTENTVLYLICL